MRDPILTHQAQGSDWGNSFYLDHCWSKQFYASEFVAIGRMKSTLVLFWVGSMFCGKPKGEFSVGLMLLSLVHSCLYFIRRSTSTSFGVCIVVYVRACLSVPFVRGGKLPTVSLEISTGISLENSHSSFLGDESNQTQIKSLIPNFLSHFTGGNLFPLIRGPGTPTHASTPLISRCCVAVFGLLYKKGHR